MNPDAARRSRSPCPRTSCEPEEWVAHSLVGERPIGSDARRKATERRPGAWGSGRVWRRPRGSACRSSAAPSAEKTATPNRPEQKIARAHRLSAAYILTSLHRQRCPRRDRSGSQLRPWTASARPSLRSAASPSTDPRAVGAAAPQAAADPHERMRRHRWCRGRGRHPCSYGGHRVSVGRQSSMLLRRPAMSTRCASRASPLRRTVPCRSNPTCRGSAYARSSSLGRGCAARRRARGRARPRPECSCGAWHRGGRWQQPAVVFAVSVGGAV